MSYGQKVVIQKYLDKIEELKVEIDEARSQNLMLLGFLGTLARLNNMKEIHARVIEVDQTIENYNFKYLFDHDKIDLENSNHVIQLIKKENEDYSGNGKRRSLY